MADFAIILFILFFSKDDNIKAMTITEINITINTGDLKLHNYCSIDLKENSLYIEKRFVSSALLLFKFKFKREKKKLIIPTYHLGLPWRFKLVLEILC